MSLISVLCPLFCCPCDSTSVFFRVSFPSGPEKKRHARCCLSPCFSLVRVDSWPRQASSRCPQFGPNSSIGAFSSSPPDLLSRCTGSTWTWPMPLIFLLHSPVTSRCPPCLCSLQRMSTLAGWSSFPRTVCVFFAPFFRSLPQCTGGLWKRSNDHTPLRHRQCACEWDDFVLRVPCRQQHCAIRHSVIQR